jgi:Temperature dependent protein affecting M2 dsRNA replication
LEEIYANAWWKTLQLRSFVNEDHTLSPWGIGLADGLEKLSGHKDLYEPLCLGLELLRLKVLHHEDFSVKYSGAAMHGSGISIYHLN